MGKAPARYIYRKNGAPLPGTVVQHHQTAGKENEELKQRRFFNLYLFRNHRKITLIAGLLNEKYR
jgi:hypothetical protein